MADDETVPEVEVEASPDLRTLQGLMRKARQDATQVATVDIVIPGYSIDAGDRGVGQLYGRFRALDDYRETRKIGKRHERVRDDATRELEVAAEVLVTSSVDVFIRFDGDVADVSLNMRLGTELARWLGVCGDADQVTNAEAVFMIFPNTLKLGYAAEKIDVLSRQSGDRADEELAKN